MKRATIILSGNVQNVGLRFNVKNYAIEQKIKGQIKNMKDGTVELICETEENEINGMLEYIKKLKPPTNVENVDIKYSEYTGKFEYFEIAFGDVKQEIVNGFYMLGVHTRKILNGLDGVTDKQEHQRNSREEIDDTYNRHQNKQLNI